MVPKNTKPPMMVVDPTTIALQVAALKAKRAAEAADPAVQEIRRKEEEKKQLAKKQRERLDERRKSGYERRFWWTFAFWIWLLFVHTVGIGLFTSGFLLTRLVLDEKSTCSEPPTMDGATGGISLQWEGMGTVEGGCWYPKTFERAVVVLIDALRYDFTVPVGEEGRNGDGDGAQIFHNAFPFLYEMAEKQPNNAFLLPFIADPPTATLQRLKGLTTGTLPTFVDIGSSFGGSAIEEDNLLMQLRGLGKRIAHIGDDTWDALFPGYFEPNISKPYDSFNVWDLHTVDTGVLTHIFPLMNPARTSEWDLLIGHLLGVDHAGHRYGPDHMAMREKLGQMDRFIRDLVDQVDDNTLLVVMGDHGMDGKGDHGGESDDEVQSAVWMYSSRPVFGRTSEEAATPPPNAKIRPVNQIDLVPTLALLLGIPIPYNSLGKPIEEAFAGKDGNAWDRLAAAGQVAAAGIHRYLASYFAARGLEESAATSATEELWMRARQVVGVGKQEDGGRGGGNKNQVWVDGYNAFTRYQEEALSVCKGLWARFDIPSMVMGIAIMLFGVLVLLLYVSRDVDEDPDFTAMDDDDDLMAAEDLLELLDNKNNGNSKDLLTYQTSTKSFAKAAFISLIPTLSAGLGGAFYLNLPIQPIIAGSALISIISVLVRMLSLDKALWNLIPTNIWGWMAVVFTVGQSIGFASNSYTIWEDSILLFLLTTFGLASAAMGFRLENAVDRTLAIYHSLVFVALGRLASTSKLCREEQMPYCTSTYYASTTSSTSAPWQLAVPAVVAVVLPLVVKNMLARSRSYEGWAPAWIGVGWRGGLGLVCVYWIVDAADNGAWWPGLPDQALKVLSVQVARVGLALALVAGTTAFIWAPPCVSVLTTAARSVMGRPEQKPTVTILGYGNANGARFLFLLLNVVGACMLVTKPVGVGSLGAMLWQVLALAEILDLNGLASSAIGPVVLALLGNLYYFKTGHQAALSSIQWDSAFVASVEVAYPWSPLAVAMNTFAGQVVATAAVPLLATWKAGPKRRGLPEEVGRKLGVLVAVFAVEAAATMMWAGHLRRHLMLYRVFNPRFMLAAAALLVVDLVGMVVALAGARTNGLAVAEIFGFAD